MLESVKNTGEIWLRLDRLEQDMEKHQEKDDKAFKYSHNMMENALSKLASIERTLGHYEGERMMRAQTDTAKSAITEGMNARLQTIERLVWVALGGVIVIGALITLASHHITKILTGG